MSPHISLLAPLLQAHSQGETLLCQQDSTALGVCTPASAPALLLPWEHFQRCSGPRSPDTALEDIQGLLS